VEKLIFKQDTCQASFEIDDSTS